MTAFGGGEIEAFRADIARSRVPGAHSPGRWSVAPGNRDPGVSGVMPARVRLRDTTMRTIGSLSVTRDAKQAFLRRLAACGVPEIVLPRTDDSGEAVAAVKSENPDCVVVCPFVSTVDSVGSARRAGYDGVQVTVPGFGPASSVYDPVGRGEAWTRADFVARSAAVVAHARACGLRVVAALMMASYLTREVLAETLAALADADEITLFDGPGALGPEAFADLVRATGTPVGVHPHNTFGLAVACAVGSARAGAEVVEVSVNGYCGGPGNADLAATAAAFEALYGVRTGLHLAHLTGLSREAARLTGHPTARNQPVVGSDAFYWGDGDWVRREAEVDPLLHNCVEPTLFGNERR
ncbi:isopropylmalate/homocitrate/citramalate synthase [Saccharothrix tamanrassetensis]|uniref:Isopropylmalate/homocitrate/citramalate synthase n=1 Tax=Saccharothrix tamanrassetensis TaxID=1051531 RepID=A0A841CN53_9PSEU|nr:hypothetical protein [Saccharothrix tamanrassetensis]MBB5956976.1 isopropylmalate/homocitrate/citramalate synthase [Saccharothrix tamanrassetensis]